MTSAAHIDLYQLTSLVPHHARERTDEHVVMTFFSRRLPRSATTKEPARGYLLWAGLQRCLDYLATARFTEEEVDGLLKHPVLGPALSDWPDLVDRLREWRFAGRVWSPREGTPLFAGKAVRLDGSPVNIDGVRPAAYCPYLVIETNLLSAKLIETPLLSFINHMTMVATKASMVVASAKAVTGGNVLEFGTRRTHPDAAIDAALAAYIGGASATSNVGAYLRHGIPAAGTMDHFAIQAWEMPNTTRSQSESAYFREFHVQYPDRGILLVDTYDTFGAKTGIRSAVKATKGGPWGIRIDSQITRDNVWKARRLLNELGATHTKIFVSGGMDEHSIAALGDAPVDGYGVGERIVTSPDAPVGVGAVGKLSLVGERPSMKLSRGSGKATLPGRLQCWRRDSGDVVGLVDEEVDGRPLLEPVWTDDGRLDAPAVAEVQAYASQQLAALPDAMKQPRSANVAITDALFELITECVHEASDGGFA
jgi:nicotinate phosphoribosyltransferase